MLPGAGSTAEAGMRKFSDDVADVLTSLIVCSSFPESNTSGAGAFPPVSVAMAPLFWLAASGLMLLSIVMAMVLCRCVGVPL